MTIINCTAINEVSIPVDKHLSYQELMSIWHTNNPPTQAINDCYACLNKSSNNGDNTMFTLKLIEPISQQGKTTTAFFLLYKVHVSSEDWRILKNEVDFFFNHYQSKSLESIMNTFYSTRASKSFSIPIVFTPQQYLGQLQLTAQTQLTIKVLQQLMQAPCSLGKIWSNKNRSQLLTIESHYANALTAEQNDLNSLQKQEENTSSTDNTFTRCTASTPIEIAARLSSEKLYNIIKTLYEEARENCTTHDIKQHIPYLHHSLPIGDERPETVGIEPSIRLLHCDLAVWKKMMILMSVPAELIEIRILLFEVFGNNINQELESKVDLHTQPTSVSSSIQVRNRKAESHLIQRKVLSFIGIQQIIKLCTSLLPSIVGSLQSGNFEKYSAVINKIINEFSSSELRHTLSKSKHVEKYICNTARISDNLFLLYNESLTLQKLLNFLKQLPQSQDEKKIQLIELYLLHQYSKHNSLKNSLFPISIFNDATYDIKINLQKLGNLLKGIHLAFNFKSKIMHFIVSETIVYAPYLCITKGDGSVIDSMQAGIIATNTKSWEALAQKANEMLCPENTGSKIDELMLFLTKIGTKSSLPSSFEQEQRYSNTNINQYLYGIFQFFKGTRLYTQILYDCDLINSPFNLNASHDITCKLLNLTSPQFSKQQLTRQIPIEQSLEKLKYLENIDCLLFEKLGLNNFEAPFSLSSQNAFPNKQLDKSAEATQATSYTAFQPQPYSQELTNHQTLIGKKREHSELTVQLTDRHKQPLSPNHIPSKKEKKKPALSIKDWFQKSIVDHQHPAFQQTATPPIQDQYKMPYPHYPAMSANNLTDQYSSLQTQYWVQQGTPHAYQLQNYQPIPSQHMPSQYHYTPLSQTANAIQSTHVPISTPIATTHPTHFQSASNAVPNLESSLVPTQKPIPSQSRKKMAWNGKPESAYPSNNQLHQVNTHLTHQNQSNRALYQTDLTSSYTWQTQEQYDTTKLQHIDFSSKLQPMHQGTAPLHNSNHWYPLPYQGPYANDIHTYNEAAIDQPRNYATEEDSLTPHNQRQMHNTYFPLGSQTFTNTTSNT